ncbi:MAG: efflux RND transporter periplasmic adaptor subunit [Rhodothermales bacterium]|nr:efflux RND transporter periplasmic adaptor subunit [Rhodothermales bacterium]
MKKAIWIGAILLLGGASAWYFLSDGESETRSFRFVTVERGNLESVVSSTGTLEAVTTVQVGTQVSGIINKIYVDFNDNVRKGQIIAQLDTSLLSSAVEDAQATIARNEAQLNQAQLEFERTERLFANQVVTEIEHNAAKYTYEVAVANLKSAEINMKRAQQNLEYATIYAPMAGKVIERNVDVGQTVAASLSAPQLFLIANDLSKMQILASVDESDIGAIKEGMAGRFTVQAYPDEEFMGTVRQVRLQSTSTENVVNYTVVVDVTNDDGRLLPGMTATVDFLIETVDDVLMIQNAALRFRPTQDMITEFRDRMTAMREATSDSTSTGGQRATARDTAGQSGNGQGVPGAFTGEAGVQARQADVTTFWYLDEDGQLNMARARTGITDGQSTQITGRRLEEGMQIIAGVTEVSSSSEDTNPFQQQQQSGGFRRGF